MIEEVEDKEKRKFYRTVLMLNYMIIDVRAITVGRDNARITVTFRDGFHKSRTEFCLAMTSLQEVRHLPNNSGPSRNARILQDYLDSVMPE